MSDTPTTNEPEIIDPTLIEFIAAVSGGVNTKISYINLVKVLTAAILLNTNHKNSDGKNHSDVVANIAAILLNTNHRDGDGSDHSWLDQNMVKGSTVEFLKIIGGVLSGEDLELESTLHATKGDVIIQKNGGKLGVGTPSPTTLVDIVSDADMTFRLFKSNDTNNETIISLTSSGSFMSMKKANGIVGNFFRSYGDSYFNAGNLGIGTNSPNRIVEINGPSGEQFRISRDSDAGQYSEITGGGSQMKFTARSPSAHNIFIWESIDNATALERMRIDSNGNVGIDETSPSERLEVNGNVKCIGLEPQSFTTGTLPAAAGVNGKIYHDSTLNKLVRSNGSTYDTM